MDVQIFDHDGRDNSILYNFAHSGRQKAIVAARFSCFERAQIFEASFSTLSANKSQSVNQSGRPIAVVLRSESSTTMAPAAARGHLIQVTWG